MKRALANYFIALIIGPPELLETYWRGIRCCFGIRVIGVSGGADGGTGCGASWSFVSCRVHQPERPQHNAKGKGRIQGSMTKRDAGPHRLARVSTALCDGQDSMTEEKLANSNTCFNCFSCCYLVERFIHANVLHQIRTLPLGFQVAYDVQWFSL